MSNSKNCPNCGAPYDIELNTCPFCKTSYFDMSCIDFEDCKPIYLKLKINIGVNQAYLTQKVIPRLGEITMNIDTVDVTDNNGIVINRFVRNRTMTTDISFEAIQDYKSNSLYMIQIE